MFYSFFTFLLIPILIVIDFFVAQEFYRVAVMKGWSNRKYFWFCFLLIPIGYLLVIALPDRGGTQLSVVESEDLPEI